jgi:pimeloyl-ACP methyl ester carboxylesterase
MGNSWTGVSDDLLLDAEKQMLSYSGLVYEDFTIKNVVINDKGDYVRTMEVGHLDSTSPQKEKMVLMHGYGGSGVIFYKIIKALSEKFHLILIDILGMGASSRPDFDAKTADEADEFFVNFLE